jgi:hypothetical protein
MTAVIRQSFEVVTEASGTIALKQNALETFSVTAAGALTVASATSQTLSLKQGTTDRFVVSTAGAITMTSVAAQIVTFTDGVTDYLKFDASGNLDLNCAADKDISLKQGGTDIFQIAANSGNVALTAEASATIDLKQNNVSAFSVATGGALTLASTISGQNINITPFGAGSTIIGGLTLTGNIINQVKSESLLVGMASGTYDTPVLFTAFADTTGTALVLMEAQGTGGSGSSNAMGIFVAGKALASTVGTINTLLSVASTVSGSLEQLVLTWPAAGVLRVEFSEQPTGGSGTIAVKVTVISAELDD